MKRMTGLFLAVAMMVGMLAVPAAANPNLGQLGAVGTFVGEAKVGKLITAGSCDNSNHQPTLGGGGLGLPELKRAKNGWYTLKTTLTAVTTVPSLVQGDLLACGRLWAAGSVGKAPIGAACGASSSNSGFGSALGKKLTNLGWATAIGGLLPVTGRTAEGPDKKKGGHVIALVLASGAVPCTDKSAGAKPNSGAGSGATLFTVAGAFALVN